MIIFSFVIIALVFDHCSYNDDMTFYDLLSFYINYYYSGFLLHFLTCNSTGILARFHQNLKGDDF